MARIGGEEFLAILPGVSIDTAQLIAERLKDKLADHPQQFDDTAKLEAAGKLEAKLQQRNKLMNIGYAQLPEEEKEKDRVVARALLQAIVGGTPV